MEHSEPDAGPVDNLGFDFRRSRQKRSVIAIHGVMTSGSDFSTTQAGFATCRKGRRRLVLSGHSHARPFRH
jgi:hypothetical protein